jgi:hypothetical protein
VNACCQRENAQSGTIQPMPQTWVSESVCYFRRIEIWGSQVGKGYLLSHLKGLGGNGSVTCERGREVLERTIHELNAGSVL